MGPFSVLILGFHLLIQWISPKAYSPLAYFFKGAEGSSSHFHAFLQSGISFTIDKLGRDISPRRRYEPWSRSQSQQQISSYPSSEFELLTAHLVEKGK